MGKVGKKGRNIEGRLGNRWKDGDVRMKGR